MWLPVDAPLYLVPDDHPAADVDVTLALLSTGVDAGPDGTQVIARGWIWRHSNPLHVVCVTADN